MSLAAFGPAMTLEQQRDVWEMLDKVHLADVARRGPDPIFATISGAHLYGFASQDSDVDLRGAFLLPAAQLLGLHPPAETISIEDKTTIDLDWVAHDIRKFARLMTNHNGYVLEQLFSPLVVLSTPAHAELMDLGKGCVTRPTVRHYQGFARGRRKRLAEPDPTIKHLRCRGTPRGACRTVERAPVLPSRRRMTGRKVLVLGSGGREHALADALLASPSVSRVVVSPGNAGTLTPPAGLPSGKALLNKPGAPLEVARDERPDLVVVGPEAPLTEGLIDLLSAEGFLAFGPSRRAAALEGSKAFMKEVAARHGLRTARFERVTDVAEVERVVGSFERPPVVKADGLCAGKGVVVAVSHDEAVAAARDMLAGRFGAAGATVVIEEQLVGQEASVHAICDGERAFVLPAAQDHKRIFDDDRGPNTGGMGTYAPAPLITPVLAERVRREIIDRAVAGMAADGNPFRGTLFAGLMITPEGEPYLLEFNVRFGDPETQVLMNVLDGDVAELLASAARGALSADAVTVAPRHAVCVVLAAPGYPGTPEVGSPISGLERAAQIDGVRVYHAGTRIEAGATVTSGGRVLGVTARGSTLAEAHERAYRAADAIEFRGKQLRRDIARRALSP